MTDSEREQILKMIEDGKITAEEGLKLIQALETGDEPEPGGVPEAEIPPQSPPSVDPVVERMKRRVRSLYFIPLGIGVLLTVLFSWLMYLSIQASQMGFVFYCVLFPALMLGILLIALGASTRSSRWIYVDVRQKPGEKPGHIMIGFPLDLASGLMHVFGGAVPGKEREKFDLVMNAVTDTTRDEPLVVQVDEGENGDRVQVYIG
jgi:hypothetical protein